MCFSSDPPLFVSRAHGRKARRAERKRITKYSRKQIPSVQQASLALHAVLGITPGEQVHATDPAVPWRVPSVNEVMDEPARRVVVMGPPPLPVPSIRSSHGRRNVVGEGMNIPSTGSLVKDMQLRGFYPVSHNTDSLYRPTLQEDVSYRDYSQRNERTALLLRGTLTTVHSEPSDEMLGLPYSSPNIPVATRLKEHKRGMSKSPNEAVKPRKVPKIDDQNTLGPRIS